MFHLLSIKAPGAARDIAPSACTKPLQNIFFVAAAVEQIAI